MTPDQLLNVLIMVVMALSGVLMAIILYEIRKVRERLHKVEGSTSSILAHLEFMNKWLGNLNDMNERVLRLELVRK